MENVAIENIKKNIENLIIRGFNNEAIELLEKLIEKDIKDVEVYSMYSVALNIIGDYKKAIVICLEGLNIEPYNFDLNYNLACIYENIEEYSKALTYFNIALNECNDETLKENIKNILNREIYKGYNIQNKIVFLVKKGLDSFLPNIINELSNEYIVKKVIVESFSDIDKWMEWANVCWFEWCDELVEYGSNNTLAVNKKIICRLHSYEAFDLSLNNINWSNIDKIIFISEKIKNIVVSKYKIDINKTIVIPNGINIEKYKYKNRKNGFNVAYVGYINYKKGPMLLLHTFKAIYDMDNRYKLYIAGKFQDTRDYLYFNQMIVELGIKDNVIFDGWQENLDNWLEDKNYILCTSLLESQNVSVMQAMAKGVKPIIHNFVGAREIYRDKFIWNNINEAVKMIRGKEYNSIEYRKFIEEKYSLDKQVKEISKLIKEVISLNKDNNYKEYKFNYREYWNNRYKSGGNSGAGSYGKLAEFKSKVINQLIQDNNINSVIEFGCGDGNQLKFMNYNNYIGLDISKEVVSKCKGIFKEDASKEFYTYVPGSLNSNFKNIDMVVCLDVLYHIVDDEDYINTLNDIFSVSSEYVVLYTILEDLKMPLSPHMKIRNTFGDLKNFKEYSIYKIVKQKYTNDSYADFIILKKKKEFIDSSNYSSAFKLLEEFSRVTKDIINDYDFINNRILMGKIERLFENNLLIEYVLENNNKQLVITGITLNEATNEIIYPKYIKDSNSLNEVDYITKKIIDSEKNYANDYIHGFIYEDSIKKHFEENRLIYSWERAIPGSQFMPFLGYLNIALRYKFTSKFIKENDYVLEAASGFGYGAAYISTIAKKVEALDIAKENIDFGKSTYILENINWIEGDVTKLPYSDDIFDVYISYETFEHLPLNLVDEYFKEANRVLKNGGKFIMSTPNRSNRKNVNNPYHIKEYDIKEFNEILIKYFKNIEYYSVEQLKLVDGISADSNVMIAVLYN